MFYFPRSSHKKKEKLPNSKTKCKNGIHVYSNMYNTGIDDLAIMEFQISQRF